MTQRTFGLVAGFIAAILLPSFVMVSLGIDPMIRMIAGFVWGGVLGSLAGRWAADNRSEV